jgi:hypothetical protein
MWASAIAGRKSYIFSYVTIKWLFASFCWHPVVRSTDGKAAKLYTYIPNSG